MHVYRPSSDTEILDRLSLLVREQQEWETELLTSTNIRNRSVESTVLVSNTREIYLYKT